MPGRKRKTAAQRELEGNPGHRPIPTELDFSSAGDIGKPPTWLDKDAKREWKRIVAALADLDMFRATDVGVLSSYSVAYSRWISAEKRIVAETTVITVTGSQDQTKPLKHTTGRSAVRHRRLSTPMASLRWRRLRCCWRMLGTLSTRSRI
jgi:P27 family predicted phage terminase small subunit